MRHWKLILLLVLFAGVVVASVQVAIQRNKVRALFVEAQKVEKRRDVLTAEWSRLKLQQGSDLNEVRVESNARKELGMHMPRAVDIRVIRE